MASEPTVVEALRWEGDRDGLPYLVEQTLLPDRFEEIAIETPEQMIDAMRRLAVRGAPSAASRPLPAGI